MNNNTFAVYGALLSLFLVGIGIGACLRDYLAEPTIKEVTRESIVWKRCLPEDCSPCRSKCVVICDGEEKTFKSY